MRNVITDNQNGEDKIDEDRIDCARTKCYEETRGKAGMRNKAERERMKSGKERGDQTKGSWGGGSGQSALSEGGNWSRRAGA